LKSRDPKAMVDLYDQFGRLVYSVILRAVRNPATAEDISQETFLRIWNRVATFDETKGRLEAWVVTVARNRAFDYLRALRGTETAASGNLEALDYLGRQASTDDISDQLLRRQVVKESLESLSPDQREVIELTHFEGMSQTEMADKLKKPLGTVKGLVRSALKVLRATAAGSIA
jgi:RNA polymerase sigma factor (sigma-70 family)